MANLNIKINPAATKAIEKDLVDVLFLTCEALHTEVKGAKVMPFRDGTMQNESTRVEQISDTKVRLVTSTPYAQRLYYHPEYNFSKASNPNAKGRWLEDWITGSKKEWVQNTYNAILKDELRKKR